MGSTRQQYRARSYNVAAGEVPESVGLPAHFTVYMRHLTLTLTLSDTPHFGSAPGVWPTMLLAAKSGASSSPF
jgi:hypothetical protein